MRGKVEMIFFSVTGKGITPAYAGKRLVAAMVNGVMQDHPRLCGEKQYIFITE